MIEQLRSLLTLDLDQIDLRKGLMGVVAIAIVVVFVAIFGTVGMTAGLAALFVIMADQPGSIRDRIVAVLLMTGFGALIAMVAVWAGTSNIWAATLLTFIVTGVATLVSGFGPGAAVRGLLLSIWAIVALTFGGDTETAVQLAVAFASGGAIAAVILWLRSRSSPEPAMEAETAASTRTLGDLARSPLGWFSLLRASAVALAMALGALLFPDHAIWAALTVVLVMKSKAGEAVAAGILRTFGTVAGVVAAEVVLGSSGGPDAALLIGFFIAAFGMAAFKKVNYALFVLFLTALLVLSQALIGESADTAAIDRLLATILGAAIAFSGIGIGRWALARSTGGGGGAPDPTTGELGDMDTTPG